MTFQQIAQISIPYIQAIADGKTVQRHARDGAAWHDINDGESLMYAIGDATPVRIKPEPMEIIIVAKDDGTPCESGLHYQKFLGGVHPLARALKFRQVME